MLVCQIIDEREESTSSQAHGAFAALKVYSGATGEAGPAGAPGTAGPRMKRAEVLALVEDQFFEIRKQLDLQLRRTGELQAQLDQIHKLIRRLANDPAAV